MHARQSTSSWCSTPRTARLRHGRDGGSDDCVYRKSHLEQRSTGEYPLEVTCSSYLLRRTIEKHEKSTLRFANNREARIGTPVPGLELRQGLLPSGCAWFVAVVKSANLPYGIHGSECRWVHGPQLRCIFSQ
jgi:hypothetical protein